jgi:hypothetical protein
MQRNKRTSVIVVGGALAIASVGYGLGTQADDGTAVAGSSGDRNGSAGLMFERGAPPGFDKLADALGANESELRQALVDFHEQERPDRHDQLAAALAKALDKPAGDVTAALEKIHDQLRARFERRGERPDPPKPPGDRGHVRRHIAFPIQQLASALDVTKAELRAAFREIRPDRPDRPDREAAFKEHQAELAKFLAGRFNVDVDKVTDALADIPRPTPPLRGDRPGPGGHGAFGPHP